MRTTSRRLQSTPLYPSYISADTTKPFHVMENKSHMPSSLNIDFCSIRHRSVKFTLVIKCRHNTTIGRYGGHVTSHLIVKGDLPSIRGVRLDLPSPYKCRTPSPRQPSPYNQDQSHPPRALASGTLRRGRSVEDRIRPILSECT